MNLEQKISAYKPKPETVRLIKPTKLVLVSSVVAGGKNTVAHELVRRGGYQEFITNTSRSPRTNEGQMEQDGIEYHFMSLKQAEKLVDERAFVEVKFVHGNVYGSTSAEFARIAETGDVAIGDVDVQGVTEYLAVKPDTHAIFLLPPSVATWLSRLEKRYGDLEKHSRELDIRFKTAYEEILHVQSDKRFVLVINDDLDTTALRIQAVVNGTSTETSDYANAVTEHLLDFLKTKL